MDFKDTLKQLGERAGKLKENIKTEEATKLSLINPFIRCLGYDTSDPVEVIPEFIADIGIKKGEKVDYAIMKDDQVTILIECKHWAQNLDLNEGQLLRYFNVSNAKFGILTNGIQYRFYTDLEVPNKMDEIPFFEFDITDMKDVQIEELKKFHKSYFEIDKIVATASDLKYTKEIKTVINNELKNPSPTFVKFFITQVYKGKATERVLNQFTELVKSSAQQVISDIITDRLKTALKENENKANEETQAAAALIAENIQENEAIKEPSQEELESYYIIKSYLFNKIDLKRLSYRNHHSYFAIVLDNTNRKTICRLYIRGNKKHITIFSSEKKEIKTDIQSIDDIYKLFDQIECVLAFLENKNNKQEIV